MPTRDRETGVPEQLVAALKSGLGEHLVAVVLFGSRARGDASPESDWDVLVIAEGLPERRLDRQILLHGLLPLELPGSVSVVGRTPDEFESHLPSFYLDVALDGRVLYDPRRYASRHLARLRRVIASAGLYRERTEAGDVWRWRNAPEGSWSVEWGR